MKLYRFLLPASRARRSFNCGLLAAITLILPLSEKAQAIAYTFTNIADTSSGVFFPTSIISPGIGSGKLSINDSGTVAFASKLFDGSNGIFTGNGGPITSIALSSGPIFSNVVSPSINASGTVAFSAALDAGGSGIFIENGAATTAIALTTDPTFSGVGVPSINDGGTVAFSANLDAGGSGLFTSNAGSITTIALRDGPIFGSIGFNTSINASGRVAFPAILQSGQEGFFTGDGGPITAIALVDFFPGVSASINDSGRVAFTLDSGVITGDGESLTLVASSTGPFSGFGIHPAINAAGTVAFWATLDIGGSGIFTGSDPVANKVIRTEDLLFGSHVDRLSLVGFNENPGNVVINDLGQVAFHYELFDGRQGIAVATPVPEPGAAQSVLLGVSSLILLRRRPNRSD